jgi:RsiW-degrading membrane proteinase PrsW (M82 family)
MIGAIILVAFIKLSIHYNNPLVLAGSYTLITALFSMGLDVAPLVVLVSAIITFGLMWLFFWLLDRYDESGIWWVIVAIFPVLMLVLSSAQ